MGYQFEESLFARLFQFLDSNPKLSIISITKGALSEEQKEKVLRVVNSNLMKGVKLHDEHDKPFGDLYTDLDKYNQEKLHLCELNETTRNALSQFDDLPEHIIDFGAGTGKETMALLMMGCSSIVAIDGDLGATSILEERSAEFIEKGYLQIYTRPFLTYRCEKKADFFYSSFTWPYRPPQDFLSCWNHTKTCIKPGGWIAGHFFGAPEKIDPAMTYHCLEEIERLLAPDFEQIVIFEKDTRVYGGGKPAWGVLYHVVAQKKKK